MGLRHGALRQGRAGGAKKLAEALAYLYGDGLTEQQFLDFVAPLVPDREEARAIVWGGKAACDACKLERMNFEAMGERFPEGHCIRNASSGGGCRYPAPRLLPRLEGLWEVHSSMPRGATVAAGMDGVPMGRDLRQVEVVARAVGEPFDADFVKLWATLENFWLFQELRALKAARAAK